MQNAVVQENAQGNSTTIAVTPTTWTWTYGDDTGSPPIPIDGTATVTSPPATLTAIETRAHLVADPLP